MSPEKLGGDDARIIPLDKLSDLAMDAWRVHRRVGNSAETPETVRIACEILVDRLRDIGLHWDEMLGEEYHENMRVQVIETHGDQGLRIVECLSPAIYFDELLIRPAAVVIADETVKG